MSNRCAVRSLAGIEWPVVTVKIAPKELAPIRTKLHLESNMLTLTSFREPY
jgi:hypothetical protein